MVWQAISITFQYCTGRLIKTYVLELGSVRALLINQRGISLNDASVDKAVELQRLS